MKYRLKHRKSSQQDKRKINSIVDNDKITIDEAIKRIDTLENKVKFKAFGKTTHTKKSFDKVSKVKYMDNIELLEVQAKT